MSDLVAQLGEKIHPDQAVSLQAETVADSVEVFSDTRVGAGTLNE